MAVLMAGTFVFVVDFFVVNVAIPATQADLGASDGQIQLVGRRRHRADSFS